MRYQNAPQAIDWLVKAFGFEARMVVDGPNGIIAHAPLVMGTGRVMLGSATEDLYGQLVVPPGRTAGVTTQSA